jgi:hypothetical protein
MTVDPRNLSVQDGSLLLYCLGIRHASAAEAPPPDITEWEWDGIVRQACENGVAGLLYHRLRTVVPDLVVPPGVHEVLAATAFHGVAQSLRIGRELGRVLELFQHHGIRVIVLKGGHLGQTVYESFALRSMCDLDVMVRREDLTRAEAALSRAGYIPQFTGVEDVDYSCHHHVRPLARPGGARVELHWSIAHPYAPFDIDLDGIWARARHDEVVGVAAHVLSTEDLLLHLCLHAAFSHKFRVGLRACWDVLEVVQHGGDAIDWDVVIRRAGQWKAGRYVYLTLRLVQQLLGAAIPAAALQALEPPAFPSEVVAWARTSLFAPETDAVVSPSMARLWTSRQINTSLPVLLRALWPSPTAMARIYRTPPGSKRVYLYYPLRWGDLLLRYGRHFWGLWSGDHRTHDELHAVAKRAALHDWLRSAS